MKGQALIENWYKEHGFDYVLEKVDGTILTYNLTKNGASVRFLIDAAGEDLEEKLDYNEKAFNIMIDMRLKEKKKQEKLEKKRAKRRAK